MSVNSARSPLMPEMPTGTEVAAFKRYEEAVRAVEVLGEAGFPLDTVTVVGSDLHLVEQVVGKLTPARVAISGAGQGLTWGLLMALLSFFMMPQATPVIALIAISVGVLAGVLISVLTWSMSSRKRSFAARSSMVAARYAVLVSADPQRAFDLLASAQGNISGSIRRPTRLLQADERVAKQALGRSESEQTGGGASESQSDGVSPVSSERQERSSDRINLEPPRYGVRLADAEADASGVTSGEPSSIASDRESVADAEEDSSA